MNLMKKNIISAALWGDNPLYIQGAFQNAVLLRTTYGLVMPEMRWRLRIYMDAPLLQYTRGTFGWSDLEVECVPMEKGDHPYPIWWRLLAIADPDVRFCCFRDMDSRFSMREALAVRHWITETRAYAHVMRDNPAHMSYAMLGGMWGLWCVGHRTFGEDLQPDDWRAEKPIDSVLLSRDVWPQIKDSCVQHVREPWADRFGGEAFPPECDAGMHPEYDEYVGKIVQVE